MGCRIGQNKHDVVPISVVSGTGTVLEKNVELVKTYLIRSDICYDKNQGAERAGEAFLWSGSLGNVSLTYEGDLTEEEGSTELNI